jgi:PIN domain nuclease of toxin-antitoxin system
MTKTTALLLDTHIWIWLVEGADRLPQRLVTTLDSAASDGRLWVHPISAWEVATLSRKGRLRLGRPVREWISEAINLPGIGLAPVTSVGAVEAALLETPALTDPADRWLVATAWTEGATLVTMDRQILRCAASAGVRVLSD